MINKIISLFLSLTFALGGFSHLLFPRCGLDISKCENTVEYMVDGKSEDGLLSFGVIGNINLFEPEEEIQAVIECTSDALYSTWARVSVTSEQADFDKKGYFKFDNEPAQYVFSFSSKLNGIFTITIKTTDNKEYSFDVGVMPKNPIASDNFYYGVQPYITRAKCWGSNNMIPGFDADESVDKILDTAEYMGVNLIREDGVNWGTMQPSAYADANFEVQDALIEKTDKKGIKYNWILGGETSEWSISDKYKDLENIQNIWSYPPNEAMWEDYVTRLAAHYAGNENILWEIWNEPDWEFFNGTKEEYFSLLENTAKIIKTANPNAYIYSGGLALVYPDNAIPYYQKSAELIDKGLLDNWAYHNHYGKSDYAENVRITLTNARSAGLKCGGINSESGIFGTDASLIAKKALYTRSTGSDGYVSFSFRRTINDMSDVSDYAFFNEYLQPGKAVLSFATVIGFLGNAQFIGNRSDKLNINIDEYSTANGTVLACYSFGEAVKIKAPDNAYACYDMYGNPVKLRSKIKITEDPIYIFLK